MTTPEIFIDLSAQICREDDMLPTTADALYTSYDSGLASMIFEDGQVVAYSRLIPLLNPNNKSALGLPESTPDVYELGTVWVHEDYRHNSHGRNYANEVLGELYQTVAQINNDGGIVLGTLVNIKMAKKLIHSVGHTGVGMITRPMNNNSQDPLGVLTCVCDTPNKGKFGVQFGQQTCEVRTNNTQPISLEQLVTAVENKELIVEEDGGLGGCYMFVLSPREQISNLYATVMNHYGIDEAGLFLSNNQAMNNFVQALQSINYFA